MPGEKLIQTANIWLSCTKYFISAGLLWWISSVHRWGLWTVKISASVKKSANWNMESWLVPLRNIMRIRRFIDKGICHHAVRSLVFSRLDYCNDLLSSVPKSHILCLQRLQNWAARIIFIVDRWHESSPMLKTLHWLPVKQRITSSYYMFTKHWMVLYLCIYLII